jgi:hypothetical protein
MGRWLSTKLEIKNLTTLSKYNKLYRLNFNKNKEKQKDS